MLKCFVMIVIAIYLLKQNSCVFLNCRLPPTQFIVVYQRSNSVIVFIVGFKILIHISSIHINRSNKLLYTLCKYVFVFPCCIFLCVCVGKLIPLCLIVILCFILVWYWPCSLPMTSLARGEPWRMWTGKARIHRGPF